MEKKDKTKRIKMETRIIVSAIVKNKNNYLIAKRASSKKYAPGKWEFISGFVDENKSAEGRILKELREEIKVKGEIIKKLIPYIINDKEARWIIIPFIIKILGNRFKINKNEHSEVKWVSARELTQFSDLRKDIKELKIR